MIITQENADKHPKALSEQSREGVVRPTINETDLPPAYDAGDAGPSTAPPAPAAAAPATPLLPPTNFVYMKRQNQSVKGKWNIDPNVTIPASMMPALEDGTTDAERKNLYVYSHNSSVDAEVWVVAPRADGAPVTLDCSSHNSSATLRIHRTADKARFSAHVASHNGSVTVHLPRSFHGPVTASSKNGSIKFSDAMTPATTVFNEVKHTMRAFVGDYTAYDAAHKGDGWTGDVLVAESVNGSVKMKYYDEALLAGTEGGKSFLGKLFGGR